jgi:hypothetical protein
LVFEQFKEAHRRSTITIQEWEQRVLYLIFADLIATPACRGVFAHSLVNN